MSNVELVKVEVVVHATLSVDGNTVEVSFVDKGGGKFELAPGAAAQETPIPDYVIEQIWQKARFNRGTD
ncbi:hypothetical protein SAMN05660284_01104 [Formivibrio citricus]|uniref:Uncharacterized protein n=1 Tax=Formivibrio citricus TaxID=83765 RepID=A0A1I4XTL4_9NEIS|nr:hypothetical protein [Formivibrio citricus]SFN29144.1 hypothetical protein SAMN05660284_01104 [Formivibrio citricus]